jgi:glycosyltransferase involved in cell wall biosynthesis
MRVVHVITSTGFGGAQIMLSRYLGACTPSRVTHSVISLMPGGAISDELSKAGVPVFELGLSSNVRSLRDLHKIRHKLAAQAPDVIFGWMYHGCLAALYGRTGLRNTALVWGIHHSLADIRVEKTPTRLLVRALAALSHKVDGLSYCSSMSRAQHEAIGFLPDRARVIPNAVDAAVFHPDPDARARLGAICGIPSERRIIGTVARSHPMKDHVSMVRALAKLLSEGRDVHGVLLGAGQSQSAAVAEATAIGISDRVSGLENRSDVNTLVPGFDAFLLSSAWGEAFPVAVAEAMAAGVPCVVTDVGDCAELVGATGAVVAPRDVDAMADALDRILSLDLSHYKAAGEAARKRVSDHFSFERYIDSHNTFYSDAIDHRLARGKAAPVEPRPDAKERVMKAIERPEANR